MYNRNLFGLALLALGTSSHALMAEDITLSEIVIVAPGEETPGTGPATHIDAEQIARSQASSLQDVLRDVPSVSTTRRGNLLSNGITIRGFGGDHHYPGDPATQVLVDGVSGGGGRVYQNATGMVSDPALLRSVDVTTGPLASLEYGSGITGGAVAAQTINGSDLSEGKDGFRFRQLLGANSNGKGWVTSSTAAWQANDQFDVLLNYTRRAQDEQDDGDGNKVGMAGFNVPSLLLKARWRIDETNTLTFSHNRFETAERNVPYASTTGLEIFGNVDRDRKGTINALTWNHTPKDNDLIDLELKISRSDQDHDVRALNPASSAARFAGNFNVKTDRVTLKNTALFQTGTVSHKLRAGLEWSSQTRDRIDNPRDSGKDRRIGVFAVNTMDFGDDLRATVGLRFDDQKLDRSTVNNGVFGPFDNTGRTIGAGLEKGLGSGVTVFGSFTYTEALPGIDIAETAGNEVQKSRNWETGLKYAGSDVFGAGDNLSGSVTLYYNEIWNAVHSLSGSRLTMSGVELAGRYNADNGLYVHGTLNLTDHEQFKEATATASANWSRYGYSTGNTLGLTVGHKFENGIDLSWSLNAQKGITIGADRHAGFGVNDLKASYTVAEGAFEGITIDLGVENIFDKTYHHANTPLSGNPRVPVVQEPGRNLRLTLAKTF